MTELLFPERRAQRGETGPERGLLSRWLVADGGHVRTGQCVAEIRRADTVVAVRATATGTLWHQAFAGEVLDPGTPVGLVE